MSAQVLLPRKRPTHPTSSGQQTVKSSHTVACSCHRSGLILSRVMSSEQPRRTVPIQIAYYVQQAAELSEVLRNFLEHTERQQLRIAALQDECADLQEKKRMLWRRVIPPHHSRSCLHSYIRNPEEELKDQGVTSRLSCGELAAQMAVNPFREYIDEIEDEFDDVYLNHCRSCRYMDPHNANMSDGLPFKFAEPDAPGAFTTTLADGVGLFQNITEEGVWAFCNDSERYMMHVCYRLRSTSEVAPGPHATCTTLPSGEMDISVKVLPEETEILFFGEVTDYQNLSKTVPIDRSFVNKHVVRHNDAIQVTLNAITAQLRLSSYTYVSPDNLLNSEDDGSPFVDPDFLPCRLSLCGPETEPFFLWDLPWRRPMDYLAPKDAADVRLFRGQVLPGDPCPGDGHDLYLCSAAAIVAEFPNAIRALFRHPARAEDGRRERAQHGFRVTINVGGWWTTTLLDDYFPSSKKGPEFGRCEEDLRKLWYSLLEKAYAKAHGSYAAIQEGEVGAAVRDLSGFPTASFDEAWRLEKSRRDTLVYRSATVNHRDALFAQLMDWRNAGHLLYLKLPPHGPPSSKSAQMGMRYGMTYAVMDLVQYQDFQLVQIRCPTMVPGWDGLWCPESVRWRQEPILAERCGMLSADTQSDCLWLDWASEALRIFVGGGICYTAFEREDYRVKGVFKRVANSVTPTVALEVTVTQPIRAYCMLSQARDNRSPSCSPLMLALVGGMEGPEEKTVTVQAMATGDPHKPGTTRLGYVADLQVALEYEFLPDRGPYYLLPCAQLQGSTSQVPYVLGLLPNTVIDGKTLSVRFVVPDVACPVFSGQLSCPVEELTREAHNVFYQRRCRCGRATSKSGSMLSM